ncbi:MAG: hypothetical protein GC185_05895 [Alphaproteobacteria bacterium]|nr:hypothetical protein [Alphaproteobacteria bacterium]
MKKMKKMKKIKILFAFLAVMALASSGAAPLFHAPPAYAEEGGGEAKKGPPPDFEYLQLKPLTLPVITAKGLTQQVSLLVSLEVPYGTKDAIKEMEPKLADAYISDLYGALGAGQVMLRGHILDVGAIKTRLTKDTEKVLGPDKVHDVLLQAVQQSGR